MKLSTETLDILKSDPDLFHKVCKEMKVKPSSLVTIINRNSATLNRFSVVQIISDYLKVKAESLMQKEAVS